MLNSDKGYGYATTADGRELLITVTAIRASGFRRVDVGEVLTLEVCHRLEFGDTFSDKRAVIRIQKLPRESQLALNLE